MQGLKITLELEPSQADIKALGQGLSEQALAAVQARGFQPIAVFARDADGVMVGGIQALVNWNWLHICLAWLEEGRRRQGLGTELLQRIEQAGIAQGCVYAHLDTFSYQARPFYEKRGYVLFGQLDDYPPGHTRYYMRKSLT
ncbi:MAG: GNAT family N-acetyltransferase [Nevskiales bacterium]